jgi:type II secretory pathway pseudopilin PulG
MFFKRADNEKSLLAFTLAEVLITLLIIGVISSIVIPALLQDSQNAELKAALKKTYSDLNQAASRAASDNAGTFVGFITGDDNTMLYLLAPYLNITKQCLKPNTIGVCWHQANTWNYLNGNTADGTYSGEVPYNGAGAILANGTLLKFYTYGNCSAVNCGSILVDVNGFKKPNIMGKDIFMIYLTLNSIKPFGYQGDGYQNTCTTSSSGMGCTANYLLQ